MGAIVNLIFGDTTMKKLLLITAMFMATSVWADWNLYGSAMGNTKKLGSYSDYAKCENAKWGFGLYENLRCVEED